MGSARKTIARLVSLLLPQRRRPQASHPLPKDADPQPQSHSYLQRPITTIESLNQDVLRLIALELRERKDIATLQALASCSHSLHAVIAPVLLKHVKTNGRGIPSSDSVRLSVRRLRFTGLVEKATDVQSFAAMLNSFPALTEIIFGNTFVSPWEVLKCCLSHPSITSIVIHYAHVFAVHEPPSGEEIAGIPLPLSTFSYILTAWREHRLHYQGVPRTDHFAREAKWLAALVPNLAGTVKHLDLPMETIPLRHMSELSWPELRTLSIRGRYLSEAQVDSLPSFLSTLPQLQKLSVLISRRKPLSRPPVLGRIASPSAVLSGLRALTVAYPDPEDDIFSVDTTRLSHLSLCDWPRYYHDHTYDRRLASGWARPILRSVECLSILKRMDMPDLSSLEVVYLADVAGSDDDLLTFIADGFPRLAHLELHRYRADRGEAVDYVHIANLLKRAHSLCTVRLNLDFHDDHGPYCNAAAVREAYWPTFRDQRGPEIVGIMDACPSLEYVELLYHGQDASRWPRFKTLRYPEPRFSDSLDPDLRDSEPLPRRLR